VNFTCKGFVKISVLATTRTVWHRQAPQFRGTAAPVFASFDRRCLSTPPCSISSQRSQIPYGECSSGRLTASHDDSIRSESRLKGTRLSALIQIVAVTRDPWFE